MPEPLKSLKITAALHKKLKLLAAEGEVTLQELLERLVKNGLQAKRKEA